MGRPARAGTLGACVSCPLRPCCPQQVTGRGPRWEVQEGTGLPGLCYPVGSVWVRWGTIIKLSQVTEEARRYEVALETRDSVLTADHAHAHFEDRVAWRQQWLDQEGHAFAGWLGQALRLAPLRHDASLLGMPAEARGGDLTPVNVLKPLLSSWQPAVQRPSIIKPIVGGAGRCILLGSSSRGKRTGVQTRWGVGTHDGCTYGSRNRDSDCAW